MPREPTSSRAGSVEAGDEAKPYDRPPTQPPQPTAQAQSVAQHYNARPEKGVQARQLSPIIRLRSFNNWVKMVLIRHFAAPCKNPNTGVFRVLDLGCGMGGDIHKWGSVGVTDYVGCDIASASIEKAKERFKQKKDDPFDAEFHALDCFGRPITDVISADRVFDAVSMQFCLHYAFETQEKARQMLENASKYLRTGGIFIGTLPDADWIFKRLMKAPGLSFGNGILNIRFEQKKTMPTFGHKYYFCLEDAIDDCPEYLVHFPTLVKMAKDYGLKVRAAIKFLDFYEQMKIIPEYRGLLTKMRVLGGQQREMSHDEWETASAYMVFVFEKVDMPVESS